MLVGEIFAILTMSVGAAALILFLAWILDEVPSLFAWRKNLATGNTETGGDGSQERQRGSVRSNQEGTPNNSRPLGTHL